MLLVEAHKCTQPEVPKVRAISQAPLSLPGSTYPSLSLMSTDTSRHLLALCRLYLTRQKYRSGEIAQSSLSWDNPKVIVRHLLSGRMPPIIRPPKTG